MLVTLVTVHVKEEHVDDFISATLKNHEQSIQEDGNMRFDVLQSNEDRCRFTLYEAYESEAASKAHKDTAHYLAWRDAVADWMAKPREGAPHQVIAPKERAKW